MTKTLIGITAAVVMAAVIGYAICRFAGLDKQGRPALVAAIICSASAALASLPALLSRKADMATASQAGLAGTLGHLLLTLILAAAAWMLKVVHQRQTFLLWLVALYWVSLVVLVCVVVRLIRRARPMGK